MLYFKHCFAGLLCLASSAALAQSSGTPNLDSLTLNSPLGVASGGTSGTTAAAARSGIGAAASGANTDITSLGAPALGAATATTAASGDSSTKVSTTGFSATNSLRGDLAQSLTAAYQAQMVANLGVGSALADGCVRISAASSTVLQAAPQNCSTLYAGGAYRVQPTVSLTLGSLTVSTKYYVYEDWSSGSAALSVATTGYLAASDGRLYESNGASTPAADGVHRLVGMIYTGTSTSAPLADTQTFRGVANYFNRRTRDFQGPSTAGGTITSSAGSNGNNPGAVATVLTWADEAGSFNVSGYANQISTVNALLQTAADIDGSVVGNGPYFQNPTSSGWAPLSSVWSATLSEGAHVVTPYTSLNAGSANVTVLVTGFVRN